MKSSVNLDEVLLAFKRYCESNGMDGLDLWYWLNTHHVRLTIKPRFNEEEWED